MVSSLFMFTTRNYSPQEAMVRRSWPVPRLVLEQWIIQTEGWLQAFIGSLGPRGIQGPGPT